MSEKKKKRSGIEAERAFVEFFRSAAPYVHAHRGRTVVILFGGEAVESGGLPDLVHDVALLHALGLRVVLIVGSRPQIDARLAERGVQRRYHGGLRITDDAALGCAKEAVGTARVELEALLSMGQPSSPMGGARLRVAAGNFVTARPMGVIDGVDLMHTGAVRRVDAEAIRQRLDAGSIVVLGSIGYSITGEAFNVSTHEVAAATAIALGADKLVCLFEGRGLRRAGDRLGDLDLAETRALLGSRRKLSEDQRRSLEAAVDACEGGVGRVHLLPRRLDGGLLTELFTREGAGTLITRESFEDIRQATQRDVPGLLRLIEPLAERGVLVRRPREMLEMEFDRFFVVERDGLVVACAALYAFPAERKAELACLAVHDRYREAGRGEALLGFLERRARQQKFEHLFVLTTQTDHWFIERGFERVSARALPRARRQQLDPRRRSKVLEKRLLG